MSADARVVVVRAQNHRDRVPADEPPDPQLHRLVPREIRLLFGGDRVDVARLGERRDPDVEHARALEELVDDEASPIGSGRLNERVERIDPLLRLVGVDVGELLLEFVEDVMHVQPPWYDRGSCERRPDRATLHLVENDPRRRRPRGRRSPRDAQKPTRPPAQPRPPGIRSGAARDHGSGRGARRGEPTRADPGGREAGGARSNRPQRSRSRPPSGPGDLRVGSPCVIVLDCRDGEPDRTGAAATFEGFFDLETGDPRRPGMGIPRLRVVAPPTPAIAAESLTADDPGAAPVPAPARSTAPAAERLWGFECWWRPDPAHGGLTPSDHEELEQSKKLIRGLLRDTRRAGRSLQPRLTG